MSRDYRTERDAVIQRWYGGNPRPRNPRPHRCWSEDSVTPADCFGVPMQVNSPFTPFGHCMVWKYGLNRDGYGVLTIEGKQELAHRAVFIQTRGQVPEGRQVNHLCNRPYCVQPSHLYSGTPQDNKDDSQIFSKEELLHAPWVLFWSEGRHAEDPLLQRLLESNRCDGIEPWEPVAQPVQRPLEEFTCPGHDFAITMFGGNSTICRICESSEFQEGMFDELGTPSLIKELWPASQTVAPIFEKIVASEFAAESLREARGKAYSRSRQGFGMGTHSLRDCGCEYCARDRTAFRDAIEPRLTKDESELLYICDRLHHGITTALEGASVDMMAAWGRAAGLNEEQTRALMNHHRECPNTKDEMSRTTQTLEGELGYLIYALGVFGSRHEMLKDQVCQLIMSRIGLFRMRREDEGDVQRTVMPVAEKTARSIVRAWEEEAEELIRPYLQSKPEFRQDIGQLSMVLAVKGVLEHLRFALLGRNSFSEQQPHPHSSCAASIVETGRVQPYPR
ncbi:MAG: HNH endonuclease [Chloroflexota bacterium]|nr:HNH endonuclease [Chloroflexota bacterium]